MDHNNFSATDGRLSQWKVLREFEFEKVMEKNARDSSDPLPLIRC